MTLIDSALAPHPGAVLKRKLMQLQRPKSQIAQLLGLSRQTLYDLLAGKQSMTANVALRVARLTGTSPENWLELQNVYDLAVARRSASFSLDNVPVLEEVW